MANIKHYINGIEYDPPRDWEEIEITIDWLEKNDSGSINISELVFVNEMKDYLIQRFQNGLNGGVGIFEGEPYEIRLTDENNNTAFNFDGYIDFTEGLDYSEENEELICSLKKRKGEDWLNDVADSFSFAYLYDQGIIQDSDFKAVPYVINYVPDGMQLIVLSISIYMMTKEIIENVQAIAEAIADITDAGTPVVGVSVGVGAGAVTAWDLGNYILATLKTIARIAYSIAMAVAITRLIEQIFEQLLPAKRFHLGMTFRTLFEKGCNYLGLSFSSDISSLDWVYIPSKGQKGGTSGEKGFPTNTDSIYTFGNFIRQMIDMFNADYRIEGNQFIFKRRDQFNSPSNYIIPSYFNDQEKLLNRFKFNTNEIVANYNINYAYDVQDQNTLDNQQGRIFQAVTTPITKTNEDLVNIKGLTEISLPFSMGLDKQELTDVERLAKTLGGIVDDITGIFGSGTNFENQIEKRLGSLLLSSHFLSIGKVVAMSGSRLAKNQRSILDTRLLWDNYHFINSFAEYNGEHNQYWRIEDKRVPMTIQEFESVLNNKFVKDQNGNEVEIERCVYTPYNDTAVISFRRKEKYTNNLKIEFL